EVGERAAHQGTVLNLEEAGAQDAFQDGRDVAPIETVGLTPKRPGELGQRGGAHEETIVALRGLGEEGIHLLGLDRIVTGDIAKQDVGVQSPHARPFRMRSSSSASRRTSSLSTASSDGEGTPGRRSMPRSFLYELATGRTCTPPSLLITNSSRSPSA